MVLKCDLENREIVDKLVDVIVKHIDLDKEIRVSSVAYLDALEEVETKDIESINGVTVAVPDKYPAFKMEKPASIPDFGD